MNHYNLHKFKSIMKILTIDVLSPATSKTSRVIKYIVSFWQANEINVVYQIHRLGQD